MRLGIFGGTFDPIHIGHLIMAEAARLHAHLDRVIFLPTGAPPHKAAPSVGPAHRLAMVKRAIRGNAAFRVSAWEIRQRRAVYTYEALAHFKQAYPTAALFFILGSDSLRDVPRWRQGAALLKQCRFLVIERNAARWASLPAALRRRATRIASPLVDVSSHDLRRAAGRGRSIRYQVPEAVATYIQRHALYKGKAA